MNVSLLSSRDTSCENFVQEMADARLCHIPLWNDMIEKAFGHKGYYLVARENDQICGVLPLTHVRSRLFGNRMISQPFSDYGGALVVHPGALDALYHRAVEIAGQNRCESVEFRNTAALPYELHMRTDKISMCLALAQDPQEVWKGLRHKTRNRVSKAQREGLVVTSGGQELLDEFYQVWTVRMHELGTPCYPRKLFSSIMETFPNMARIFLAKLNGTTTAVLFAYTFKSWVQCSWGAALRDYDEMGPNYILNWGAIEYYCGQGMKWFDFGRSTVGSGQHTFKERWGASPIDLHWQYWTPPGQQLRLANPDDERYRGKVEMWKKLPLWVSRVIGPVISPALP
jgi:FemAB-related protein (PEP-CTERM system-associated)